MGVLPFSAIISYSYTSVTAPLLTIYVSKCTFHSCFTNSTEASPHWEGGCGVLAGSGCARATASTAPPQLRKKINLFVTDSSVLRRLELMFYLLEFCRIQCRWSTACMVCRTNRPYRAVEDGANTSRGGRVRWRSSQCGTHLCYLWTYATCTLNAFVWAVSLNQTTAMYNMQESVMLLLESQEEKKALYTWAKKLHFLMSAWRNNIEGHYRMQEYIPEKCVQL